MPPVAVMSVLRSAAKVAGSKISRAASPSTSPLTPAPARRASGSTESKSTAQSTKASSQPGSSDDTRRFRARKANHRPPRSACDASFALGDCSSVT
ncbi:hypothetical protein ABIE78_001199 [Sinorhizobium fredii]